MPSRVPWPLAERLQELLRKSVIGIAVIVAVTVTVRTTGPIATAITAHITDRTTDPTMATGTVIDLTIGLASASGSVSDEQFNSLLALIRRLKRPRRCASPWPLGDPEDGTKGGHV